VRDSDQLELVFDDAPRRGGVSIAVIVSSILHALLIIYLIRSYQAPSADAPAPPIARYVELIRQNPQFTEAPGAKVKTAPLTAPFSDANREASMPKPTGDKPTTRPGDGGAYVPRYARSAAPPPSPGAAASQQQPVAQPQASQQAAVQPPPQRDDRTFIYRPTQTRAAASAINWQGAIREVGKVASLGGSQQQGIDFGGSGGDKGFAKDGPLSFESQWYDWGEYAESMVSKIRVNWYNNMPQIIQTGLKGVVYIRITIHRDGRITDVTILSSSGVPPYDFAAKKAIELSSPLNPLPKDFPNDTERVTFGFFYNQEPPQQR
jgi:TonB family protein